MSFMNQTLISWIFFLVLCSEITVLSNSSCASLVWKRMNTSYWRHIAFSSGVKSFSNGFGYSKFLSSMNFFLRSLSSSLQCFSIQRYEREQYYATNIIIFYDFDCGWHKKRLWMTQEKKSTKLKWLFTFYYRCVSHEVWSLSPPECQSR